MTSKILGRTTCLIQCGHTAAHVKIKTDKASGTAFPYVYCPACGFMSHTKNDDQAKHLLTITRPEKMDAEKEGKAAQIEPEKLPIPPPQIAPIIPPENIPPSIQSEARRRFGKGIL